MDDPVPPRKDRATVDGAANARPHGCGTGNLALLLAHLNPEVEVVGIDPDRNALARARRKAHRRQLTVELHHGFAQRLPFPDASFDRVVSAFMFHHLAGDVKVAVLNESRRVLKAGSALCGTGHPLPGFRSWTRRKGVITYD